jgi:hypothetical protein
MEPGLPKHYSGGNTQILPMCRVTKKGNRAPLSDAIAILRTLLQKRVELEELLGTDWESLSEKLILASGGYPRDLLLLVRHMLQLTESLPVSPQILEQAIRKLFDSYQGAIYEEDFKWLARIAISHDKELLNEAHLMRLANLFRSHVVMCYYNGSPWYDLHPAVYQMERMQQMIERERRTTAIEPHLGAA